MKALLDVDQSSSHFESGFGRAYGVKLQSEEARYGSSEFKGKVGRRAKSLPGKRLWFPLSFEVYSELLPSTVQHYPYGLVDSANGNVVSKARLARAMTKLIAAVAHPKIIPLIVACDIVAGAKWRSQQFSRRMFLEGHFLLPGSSKPDSRDASPPLITVPPIKWPMRGIVRSSRLQ